MLGAAAPAPPVITSPPPQFMFGVSEAVTCTFVAAPREAPAVAALVAAALELVSARTTV
jgi:hypothetical protein